MKELLIFFMFNCPFFTNYQFFTYINQKENRIYYEAPKDLLKQVLLIPAFDELTAHIGDSPQRRAYVERVNKAAVEANATLRQVVEKNYPYRYKLISLSEVAQFRADKYRYFLDLVIMPKQMDYLKAEALVPSYEKYQTANKMYRNNNLQFHYYFYVRDLQKDDIYASSKLKGNAEVYKGIGKFLTHLLKDL